LHKNRHYVINEPREEKMKTKKFTLNLPSLVLGMALCLVLVVLLGSKAPAPQATDSTRQVNQAQARVLSSQKQVTLNTIMDKCELIDQRILVEEGKLNRLQEDMNRVLNEIGNMRREGK
jgi:hypothetical protein